MGKRNGKLAKRYARALFTLCAPQEMERMEGAVCEFADTWEENSGLRATLLNPAISLQEREEVVRKVSTLIAAENSTFTHFLLLLLRNNRLEHITQIATECTALIAALKNQLTLEVTSAFPLPENERAQIQKQVTQEYSTMTAINWHVKQEIIGGLIIKAGDRVIDNSIRSSLESMRKTLWQ